MVPHRDVWRDTVHKAASQFEENRRDSLKNKRQRRKAQAASTTKNPDLTYTARGPACLASASSATNGPPVGVDNNLPDLRSRSQAKQQFLPLSLLKFRSLIFFFLTHEITNIVRDSDRKKDCFTRKSSFVDLIG